MMTLSYFVLVMELLFLVASGLRSNNQPTNFQDVLKDDSSSSEVTNECKQESRAGLDVDYAQDCADLLISGRRASGVYFVQPLGYEEPFEVFCDMVTDGGGWTVIQRRGDFGTPENYFSKKWNDYKKGFGHLRKEFWLGNDKISALSLQRDNRLRIELQTMDRNKSYAKYSKFWVENEDHGYRLHVSGYSGDAGDSLIPWHSGQNFSTRDFGSRSSCGMLQKSGWWFKSCVCCSNLNGLNMKGPINTNTYPITWDSYKGRLYSLYSEMKIKPTFL